MSDLTQSERDELEALRREKTKSFSEKSYIL